MQVSAISALIFDLKVLLLLLTLSYKSTNMKGISTFVSIMVSTIVYITSTHAAPALAPRALPPTLSVNDAKNWLRNRKRIFLVASVIY